MSAAAVASRGRIPQSLAVCFAGRKTYAKR